MTDYDGNVYPTVNIGSQTWMAENLKTTHYADGTPIPYVEGNANWGALTASSQAYCWYNDDSLSYAAIYGALYTWPATMNGKTSSNTDPSGVQGVCPDGWHVPSDVEWSALEEYMILHGYNYDGTTSGNKIGKSLAATREWFMASRVRVTGGHPQNTVRQVPITVYWLIMPTASLISVPFVFIKSLASPSAVWRIKHVLCKILKSGTNLLYNFF